MVQFLSINFFSWISSILGGFLNFPFFVCVALYIYSVKYQSKHNLLHKIQFRATCFEYFESSSGPSRNTSKVIKM